MRGFLGLGSNLGDRLDNLRAAVQLLAARPGLRIVASSRVYETAPVGPTQPDFLNAVVQVDVDLSPRELLSACLEVEDELGRVRLERWGARTIDIDVLSLGSETIHEPGLEVPHSRMRERAFVLVPLLELEREPFLPGGRGVGEVRLSPGSWNEVRLFAPMLPIPPREETRHDLAIPPRSDYSTGKVPPERQYSPPPRSRNPSSTR